MKLLFLIALVASGLSTKEVNKNKVRYVTDFKIKAMILNEDTKTFDPPLAVTIVPNLPEVTKVDLGDGKIVGVRYILDEGSKGEFSHNVVFYELIGSEWKNLTGEEHREPVVLNREATWEIRSTINGKDNFKIQFNYLTKEA